MEVEEEACSAAADDEFAKQRQSRAGQAFDQLGPLRRGKDHAYSSEYPGCKSFCC